MIDNVGWTKINDAYVLIVSQIACIPDYSLYIA